MSQLMNEAQKQRIERAYYAYRRTVDGPNYEKLQDRTIVRFLSWANKMGYALVQGGQHTIVQEVARPSPVEQDHPNQLEMPVHEFEPEGECPAQPQ